MSDFSKFKIGSTSYDVKDANAGRSLSVSGTNLSLKNAAGTAISTVTLPGGSSGYVGFLLDYNNISATSPDNFNHTSIPVNDIIWGGYDSDGQWYDQYQITLSDFIQRVLNMTPSASCGFHYVGQDEYWFNLKSTKRDASNYIDCTFELKLESSYVAQIILKVDSMGSFISCYGEKITFSGGGGGASVTIYKVASQWTDMNFGTMTTAQEVWLKDVNTSSNINMNALTLAFTDGPVYLQDSNGSKAQIIDLVFDSGNMPQYCYVLVPNSEYGAKIRALKWSSGDQNFRLSDVNI